jgi:hypothetical protein
VNTTKLATSATLFTFTTFLGEALAGEAVINFTVPKSAYAFKTVPECAGWRQDVHELFKNEKFISGVSTVNPIAGAVVATVGYYDKISKENGGDISKLIRKVHGGSYSMCVSAVYALPPRVDSGYIELSNRHGILTTKLPLSEGRHSLVLASDDWSAWRNVEITKAGERYFVAATATNWLHNGASNQVLKITWVSANKEANQLKQSFNIVSREPTAARVAQRNEKEGPLPPPAQ